MLSKAKITQIQALDDKKQRQKQGLFLIEGPKVVEEALKQNFFKLRAIYALETWLDQAQKAFPSQTALMEAIDEKELQKISQLKTPQQVLALVESPPPPSFPPQLSGLSLYLDQIQDPGNLGSIIRIADWFGIQNLFYGLGCADWQNPKVLQASMGSFLRVRLYHAELASLKTLYPQITIYGAVLTGQNLYQTKLKSNSLLVIGNEGKGISPLNQNLLDQGLCIPRFGGAESLNAAVATGIFCAWAQQDQKP